jgi:hypothetical protein
VSVIARLDESGDDWNVLVFSFLKTRPAILIDYVFDLPDQIVPQRLYRYDVYNDYLSRHRDDFEFGYDLITRIEKITGPRTYGVYIIELDNNPNYLYVGQTWYQPEERLAQHNTGFAAFHAARPFKRGSRGTLRRDLFGRLQRYKTQAEAEMIEARVATELKQQGFSVEGGH